MHFEILESFLIVLCFTLVTTFICRKLKLPVIVGYLIAGSIIGPHALGLIEGTDQIQILSEFGIAFLMFTVGLEFSLSTLLKLKKSVFLVGTLQVVLTIGIITLIGWILKINATSMIVIGGIIAMSSTAVVLKQLTDQFELNTPHGLHATGILLFQDIAVIFLLVFISALSLNTNEAVWPIITSSLIKGVIVIAVMLILGKLILRPLFHAIAKTQQIELFTLTVLLVAIGSAWATHKLGLSYSLGAFIAGIMLAESEFKHQIKVEIRPFRDILLGLFFISIGLLANIQDWPATWNWILLMVTALMLGKSLLIFLLSILSRYSLETSFKVSLLLSQGGEFGVALLSLALRNHLLPSLWGQATLAGLLISLLISPILIRENKKITRCILGNNIAKPKKQPELELKTLSEHLSEHVILCGFGRVGKRLATFLDKVDQPYIGIDIEPSIVKNAQSDNFQVIFGDATHTEILKAVNLNKAKVLVITFDFFATTKTTLQQARQLAPNLAIIVRAQNESQRQPLISLGATTIITAMFEESLAFADYLLHSLNIPESEISELIETTRQAHYQRAT